MFKGAIQTFFFDLLVSLIQVQDNFGELVHFLIVGLVYMCKGYVSKICR
jgi:hypothetical protein